MSNYKIDFLKLAMQLDALRFGQFTLKSGRTSPYFFNAGLFNRGSALAKLGRYYAQALIDSGVSFDMLFGPAYKGIPLAAVTASALFHDHKIDVPFAYDRKEAKQHGEGGKLVGAPLCGNVVIIDDVITAGTAIRQAIENINASEARVCAALIAINRQERGKGKLSAIQELEWNFELEVISLVELDDLIDYLQHEGNQELKSHIIALEAYRTRYGELKTK